MNKIKVLFFATLRDRAGTKSLDIEISEETTVKGLKDRITREFPSLEQSMESVVISINREFAFDESIVPANAEVAMFPPVSGG
ncbi:MAG: molybdopterin converting factor subunit 1 [Anaerolineales bacterium]